MIVTYLIFLGLGVAVFLVSWKLSARARLAVALAVFLVPAVAATVWVVRVGDEPAPGSRTVQPSEMSRDPVAFHGAPAPAPVKGLALEISNVAPFGIVQVKFRNLSADPVRIWDEANSWGAARWRVLRIRGGRLESFFANPDRVFTRNIPSFTEIAGGGELGRRLDLNAGNWCGFGHCSPFYEHGIAGRKVRFETGDRIVVLYDVPPSIEAVRMGVWYGVVAAMATDR